MMKEKKRMAHKRVFFALLVMVAGIVLPVASARADDGKAELAVSCGVKAEANMSGLIKTGSEKVETGMRPGLSLGGFLNLQVSFHFSVQADFLLHYKNSTVEQNATLGHNVYFGGEIPLYFFYHFRSAPLKGQWSVGGGPFTEFGFKSTIAYNGKTLNMYSIDETRGYPIFRDSNSGFALLVGYEFPCGLQLNAGYKVSVSSLVDADRRVVALRPHTVSVGVAYLFRGK